MSNAATKYDQGKPRWDLFPRSLLWVVDVFTMGATKYGDYNWRKGMEWHRVFRARMAPAWKWWWGQKYDPEDGQHHLASVAWCAMVLMEYEDDKLGIDDRPYPPEGHAFCASVEEWDAQQR